MKELLQQLLDNIVADTTQQMYAEKFIASGDTIGTFEPVASDTEAQLSGNQSFFTIVEGIGRKPGKQPPIDTIVKWIEDKRISYDGSLRSFAYLVARKIGKEGNAVFTGKRKGIEFDKIIKTNEELFEKELADYFEDKLVSDIDKAFKK